MTDKQTHWKNLETVNCDNPHFTVIPIGETCFLSKGTEVKETEMNVVAKFILACVHLNDAFTMRVPTCALLHKAARGGAGRSVWEGTAGEYREVATLYFLLSRVHRRVLR